MLLVSTIGQSPVRTRSGVRQDIAGVRRHFAERGELAPFLALQKPRPWSIAATLVLSWALLVVSWWAVTWISLAFAPLALLVMASRQRAIGNALHDSAHGNGIHSARFNQLLLAAPMFEELHTYRRFHLSHHAELGDPARDPDFIALPLKPGEHELSATQIYFRNALSMRFWLQNVLGQLPALPWPARLRILAWWGALASILAIWFGPGASSTFVLLWMVARGTTYHLVKVFTELADHVGLVRGSIYSDTRNSPKNWLSMILHPHHDNYHLAHHLVPRVPMSRLSELHRMLSSVNDYARGHQCDAYLFGPKSVIRSWLHAMPIRRAKSTPGVDIGSFET